MCSPSSRSSDVLDNTLALDQFIERCERCRIGWNLHADQERLPQNRYELRIFDGPARAIYRGETATHAASKAMAVLDEHKVGWGE